FRDPVGPLKVWCRISPPGAAAASAQAAEFPPLAERPWGRSDVRFPGTEMLRPPGRFFSPSGRPLRPCGRFLSPAGNFLRSALISSGVPLGGDVVAELSGSGAELA